MTPDEVHQEGGAEAKPPRRTKAGPRHAAPRKPLLTRLHVPAGKAIALAAMPSAVLMGMGLTPKLAIAEPLPKNPFKDGPCVTAPDKEAEEDEGKASESPKPEASTTPTPSPSSTSTPETGAPAPETSGTDTGTGRTGAEKSGSGTADSGATSGSGASGDRDADAGADESEPEPSPSRTEEEKRNPLDPLGLGDALEDLLTPGDTEEPTAPRQPGTSPSASPSPSPSDAADDPVEDAARVEDGLRDAADTVREGAEKAGGDPENAAEDAREGAEDAADAAAEGEDAEDAATPEPDASGKEPYPCPTYDAEALANAEDEQTEAVLPNTPWRLETSLLALHGLDYHGIVKVRTQNGTVKNVLKFTATAVDIRDLHQLVDGPGGTTAHVEAAKGSTSTIRNGTVTMYTEELKGKLFGIIPITFSPESPPPLNVPEVFFTEVSVKQAGQFGGELHIPGMHLYNEG
ncbi:hydrogenase expression protein HypF [Streptomyces macrosporus]|uniref:Hydrogenase expression protein HypF n=1 Tax=Streptomyces macrosporus TaxID=44032 RepID=A0ABN3KKA1_9ACTN